MIITIESYALGIMILFIIFSTLIAVYNIAFEVMFRNRQKISYHSYAFYRKMYLLNVNSNNLTAIFFILVASVVIFGLFIASPVVRYYLFALIPIDFSMAVFVYLELTRPKYNNSQIVIFDEYYKNVKKVEASKLRLLEKINEIQESYDLETKELLKNLQKYNTIFPNNEKFSQLSALIDDNRLEFVQNKNDLVNYNTAIIGQFNDSISEYVIQGLNPAFEIPEFQQIDIPQMRKFIVNINDEFESYIKETTMTNLIKNTPSQAKIIISALEISQYFNFSLSMQDVINILRVSNNFVSDKVLVAEYLFNQKFVNNEELFNYIVENDWSWCITQTTTDFLTKKQLIQLYSIVIEKNATKTCNVLLKCSALDQTDVLDKVIATSTVNNNCIQIIKFHRLIINNAQEFDDEINKYENMTYAILEHEKNKPNSPKKLFATNNINTAQFYENKDEILNFYNQIFDDMQLKYQLLPDLLMCFYDGDLSKYENIDMAKVMNFYMENMKTLNEDGIRYLNLLLAAVVLMFDSDKDNLQTAIYSVINDKIVSDLDMMNMTKAKTNGKSIILFLRTKKLANIVPIINRIEKNRLALDDIMAL